PRLCNYTPVPWGVFHCADNITDPTRSPPLTDDLSVQFPAQSPFWGCGKSNIDPTQLKLVSTAGSIMQNTSEVVPEPYNCIDITVCFCGVILFFFYATFLCPVGGCNFNELRNTYRQPQGWTNSLLPSWCGNWRQLCSSRFTP